jgi:uncharacterized protein YjaZ
MRDITLNIANVTGSLEPHIGVMSDAFESAVQSTRRLLGADAIDVMVIDAADMTIPEWGVGGYTYGPHVVLVALDPLFELTKRHIEASLVHEFHHAMRWRGPGCGGDLAQMLVSEGLAVLFEEEVLGEAPFYSRVPITDGEIALARESLSATPFHQAKWFFGDEGMTFGFGYTYGYRLCKAYSQAAGKKASDLVDVATSEVIEHGLRSF